MFRSTTPSWSVSPGVVLRQSAQQLNDHRLKPAIFLGCSDLGTLALWHFGTLALWHFGTLALWHFGNCRRVSTGQVLAGQRCSERACARSAGGESLALPVSTAIPKLPPYVLLTVT